MRRHLGGDDGTAIVEFVWLGLLLLIPLAYLVLSVFAVQRTAFAVSAATRAAGRAWETAPAGSDRDQRAYDAAVLAARDQGLDLQPGQLSLSCSHSCCPGVGTLHVSLTVKASLPGLSAVGRADGEVPVTAHHDEVVDRFAAPVDGC